MKRYYALTIAILIFGAMVARAQDDDVSENPNALANYDANLRARGKLPNNFRHPISGEFL